MFRKRNRKFVACGTERHMRSCFMIRRDTSKAVESMVLSETKEGSCVQKPDCFLLLNQLMQ